MDIYRPIKELDRVVRLWYWVRLENLGEVYPASCTWNYE
jgi:hypothetical protein